jgi:hypothetical protein
MIKSVLVCIRDKKGAFYHPPYCVPTKDMAIRGFGDAVLKGNSDLSAHPEDFTLFMVGEFDQITGTVSPCEPLSIATGLDFVDKE